MRSFSTALFLAIVIALGSPLAAVAAKATAPVPAALAPSPSPPPVPAVPDAPSDFTNTVSAQVCARHIQFALICAGMSASGLTLVWNWAPTAAFRSLDGYNVYEVSSGKPIRVDHSTGGETNTGTILNPTSEGFTGKCYVVRAYKGAIESLDSSVACIKGAGVIEPIVLKPSAFKAMSVREYVSAPGVTGNGPELWPQLPCSSSRTPCIGWNRNETLGGAESNEWARGYVEFDPKRIAATRNVTKAVLTLTGSVNNLQCAGKWTLGAVGTASAAWSAQSTPVDGAYDLVSVLSHEKTGYDAAAETLVLDVTPVVQKWSAGQPDYGFVIKGTQEDDSILMTLPAGGTLARYDVARTGIMTNTCQFFPYGDWATLTITHF